MGVELALEADTGKLFPASNSAEEVRDRLLGACRRLGVLVRTGAPLRGLRPLDSGGGSSSSSSNNSSSSPRSSSSPKAPGGWECQLGDGSSLAAARVILATGGLSFPKLGTTGDGFQLARAHGHILHAPYPALTPLLGAHPGGEQLAGVSMYQTQISVGIKKPAPASPRSALLLTHRGWSGPAILDASHHAVRALERGEAPAALRVRWTPEDREGWEARLRDGGGGEWGCQGGSDAGVGVHPPTPPHPPPPPAQTQPAALVTSLLRRRGLPVRLAEALCAEAGLPLDRCGWGAA